MSATGTINARPGDILTETQEMCAFNCFLDGKQAGNIDGASGISLIDGMAGCPVGLNRTNAENWIAGYCRQWEISFLASKIFG